MRAGAPNLLATKDLLDSLSRAPSSIFCSVDVLDDPLPTIYQAIDLLNAFACGEPFFPCEVVDFHLYNFFVHTNNIRHLRLKVKHFSRFFCGPQIRLGRASVCRSHKSLYINDLCGPAGLNR